MANCAIVGINLGDEGKGRMVDLLTEDYDVVIRFQGGGNRQEIHEIIRRCSMEATAKMKNGEECDLLSRLAAEKKFGLTEAEMTELLTPALYIGRCPEQVSAFVEKIKPLLANADGKSAEINL